MYNEIHFRSMHTPVSLLLWNRDQALAKERMDEAVGFFHLMHDRFTRFEKDSELSALNRSQGKPFEASPELYEVVCYAVDYHIKTDGLFNPAILGALEKVGYDRSFEYLDEHQEVNTRPLSVPDIQDIRFDEINRTIVLPGQVRLDLGGIVKGWAAFKVAQKLSQFGPCLVNAGGDIMTMGRIPGTTDWKVKVMDPQDPQKDLFNLHVNGCGIATSGINKRNWKIQGKQFHHLIDPRKGLPAEGDVLSVTVIAPDTIQAEVYAKYMFFLEPEKGMHFLKENSQLAACIISKSGRVLLSETMKKYVHE